jgi:hypothetical protein
MLLNTRTYMQDRVNPDSVKYVGPANTLSVSDTFEMKRVYPKPTSTFAGVARPTAKRVKTATLNGDAATTAEAILMISGSLPVGMADADITALLADGAAFLGSPEAGALFKKLTVAA